MEQTLIGTYTVHTSQHLTFASRILNIAGIQRAGLEVDVLCITQSADYFGTYFLCKKAVISGKQE